MKRIKRINYNMNTTIHANIYSRMGGIGAIYVIGEDSNHGQKVVSISKRDVKEL